MTPWSDITSCVTAFCLFACGCPLGNTFFFFSARFQDRYKKNEVCITWSFRVLLKNLFLSILVSITRVAVKSPLKELVLSYTLYYRYHTHTYMYTYTPFSTTVICSMLYTNTWIKKKQTTTTKETKDLKPLLRKNMLTLFSKSFEEMS